MRRLYFPSECRACAYCTETFPARSKATSALYRFCNYKTGTAHACSAEWGLYFDAPITRTQVLSLDKPGSCMHVLICFVCVTTSERKSITGCTGSAPPIFDSPNGHTRLLVRGSYGGLPVTHCLITEQLASESDHPPFVFVNAQGEG
jgi:hypothetical protein